MYVNYFVLQPVEAFIIPAASVKHFSVDSSNNCHYSGQLPVANSGEKCHRTCLYVHKSLQMRAQNGSVGIRPLMCCEFLNSFLPSDVLWGLKQIAADVNLTDRLQTFNETEDHHISTSSAASHGLPVLPELIPHSSLKSTWWPLVLCVLQSSKSWKLPGRGLQAVPERVQK